MLIGYMRVSKADGSQVLDLQKDALLAADIHEDRLYSDTQCHFSQWSSVNCQSGVQQYKNS